MKSIPFRNHICPDKKVAYLTKRIALQASKVASIFLTPYKCPYCGSWHLTSHDYSFKFQQESYRGRILTFENGKWECENIPGMSFTKKTDLVNFINALGRADAHLKIS